MRHAMDSPAKISATFAAVPASSTWKMGLEGFPSLLPSTRSAKYTFESVEGTQRGVKSVVSFSELVSGSSEMV